MLSILTDADFASFKEQFDKDGIERDEKGKFVKGAPTPNARGRGAGKEAVQRRRAGLSQTVKDLLEQLEQPVEIRKGRTVRKVPAIVAINARLIHMAMAGDWPAMKKVLDLQEKYSAIREQTLAGLMERAQFCRQEFKDHNEEMPAHVRAMVEHIEKRALEGQFDAG